MHTQKDGGLDANAAPTILDTHIDATAAQLLNDKFKYKNRIFKEYDQ